MIATRDPERANEQNEQGEPFPDPRRLGAVPAIERGRREKKKTSLIFLRRRNPFSLLRAEHAINTLEETAPCLRDLRSHQPLDLHPGMVVVEPKLWWRFMSSVTSFLLPEKREKEGR